MSDTIIKVENISKQYRLGQVGRKSIKQDVNRWWHQVRGKEDPYLKIGQENDRTKKGTSDYVWALQDINFDVKQGEVLGVIGRNGAGKSTLLKVLSKVTAPTTGSIKIKGRIASLLEVGTGFHPDLSGRDNIYLNGAILGMTKKEITGKFDEIVDFAGVERYIDTPVKRYSSGMYVRLAFAVAAHLEPEILIVDEVLAVGDAEFQKKCLGKMKDVSVNDGRTVLFVSHNMQAIQNLCNRCIIMKNGRKVKDAVTHEAISFYLGETFTQNTNEWQYTKPKQKPYFSNVSLTLEGRQPALELIAKVALKSDNPGAKACFIAIDIKNSSGIVVMQAIPQLLPFIDFYQADTSFAIKIILPGVIPGIYYASFWIGPHNNETYDFIEDVVSFEIVDSPTKNRSFPHTADHGSIVPYSTIITTV